jgi:ferrochelatase
VRRNYALIGGGSPQLRLTRAQAEALEARLNAGPADGAAGRSAGARAGGGGDARFKTFLAMRYWRPSTEDALEAMAADGVRRVVTLTLFPHWTQATTGSSQKELDRVLALPRWRDHGFTVTGIDRYAEDALYLDAFAETVRRALDGFPDGARERAVILFSAHGLPQKFVDAGDPYVGQIEATRRGLLARLGVPNRQVLGYQSRTGPVKWIGPGTDDILRELGREGVKEVLVVPLSFVSDHIETLYEVDILFAGMAKDAGITDYRRPDALNSHPLFIEALARLVERHLGRTS